MNNYLKMFKKSKITDLDIERTSRFFIEIVEKYISKKEITSKDTIKKIIDNFGGLKKIFFEVAYLVENFVKIKNNVKNVRLPGFGCTLLLEYTGKNLDSFFNEKYKYIFEIFFVCNEDTILLWDNDYYLIIYKFKRVKASKI